MKQMTIKALMMLMGAVVLLSLSACGGDGHKGAASDKNLLDKPDETITHIQVTPADATVPNGVDVQYTATAYYTDSTSDDVTDQAGWLSSDTDIATIVSGVGLAKTSSAGAANITASFDGQSDSVPLIVTAATITQIQVTPADATVPNGVDVQYTAIAYYTDNTSDDVTDQADWLSSDTDVATIVSGVGLAKTSSAGAANITASFDGQSDSVPLIVTAATITHIQVTPADATVPNGVDVQYTAIAYYTDSTSDDVTDQADWLSSDTDVATIVSGVGLAKTSSAGAANITASFDGQSDSVPLIVTAATITQIQVTPADATVPNGVDVQYTAIAYYTDSTSDDVTDQAVWLSSDTDVATIVSGVGLAKTLSAGTANITASFDGQSDSVPLIVTAATITQIQVTPADATVPNGVDVQYTAIAYYTDSTSDDVTDQAVWLSSDTDVATIVSGVGLAKTLSAGTANITASFDGQSDSVPLIVTAATITQIQVTPADATVPNGVDVQYTAIAYYTDSTSDDVTDQAVWLSSDTDVATIVSGVGLAKTSSAGTANITASFDGQSDSVPLIVTAATITQIQVTPADATVPNGVDVQYTAIAYYTDSTSDDVTDQAVWLSSDTDVATIVSGVGLAKTLSAGTANITASFDGQSDSVPLIVTAATITQIQVTPADATVPNGVDVQYTAIAYYTDSTSDDVTDQAVWLSSDTDVATIVSGVGLAKTLSAGTANITASFDGQSDSVPLIVTAATITQIQVTPADATVPNGVDVQYTAIAYYTDSTSDDVTDQAVWLSSDTDVATIVSGVGLAKTLSVGTANITASFDGQSDSVPLIVTAATITQIQVTPADATVPNGVDVQYTAIAYYTDSTSDDVTDQAVWLSSDTDVATIVSGVGLAKTSSAGTANITASFDGQSDSVPLIVTAATITQIQVTPADATVPNGVDVQYTAIAYYTDSTSDDVTDQAVWLSSDTDVATIVSGVGLAKTLSVGTANITASFDGQSDSVPLIVTAATITHIQVTPADATVPNGVDVQYTAIAYYTDSTSDDVTDQAVWLSSDTDVATIVSGVGLAKTLSVGTANITASFDGQSDSVPLTVTDVTLLSIVVTPANKTVTIGSTVSYHAEGHYSDGSIVDITADVTWASSSTAVATIVTSGVLRGVATALNEGTTTIKANFDSVDGSTLLTVSGNCGTKKPGRINITPDPATIIVGDTKQFHLTGIWTACEREITFDSAVVWHSNNTAVVSMTSKGGLALGVAAGATTVNAKYRGLTDTAAVTVTP